MAFLEMAHILWEASKPAIVLTGNKLVTRFFQTKAIPPSLWNACDYVLQLNFNLAHIAGSVNKAADFFKRLELEVREDLCQNTAGCTINTHRGDIFLRCCRRRTILLHANRW